MVFLLVDIFDGILLMDILVDSCMLQFIWLLKLIKSKTVEKCLLTTHIVDEIIILQR